MNGPRFRLAVVVALLAGTTAAGGWVLSRGFRAPSAAASARLFDQVLAHVADHYVDSLGVGELYTRASSGLVAELGDPHSVFLDSARLARVQASITGLIGSLGLSVEVRDGWVTVLAAFPGTPAEHVGLRTGDRVLAIDGRSTRGWTAEEARRALRGSPGTSVRVSIVRLGGAGPPTELTMERESVYVRPVRRAMVLSGEIGYVHLLTFSDSAALELSAAVDSLYAAGMRRLILDLRGNPGGLLAQGTAVADLFLDSAQTIVSMRGRIADAQRVYTDQRAQAWRAMKIAVLVDRGTASAAEIVAGALQDHDRAVVIGRPTYGKGSAQSIFSFQDQAGVRLTTARWYTPAGRNIEFVAPSDSTDVDAPPLDSLGRPVFKTDSGRVVYGGGGIVPDIIAGDSVNAPRAALLSALGPNVRAFFAAVTAESRAIAARGAPDMMFDVTPAMRDALYARLRRGNLDVSRALFNDATETIDRLLGAEVVRYAHGRAEEARRLVLRDRVVQRAVTELGK